MSLFLIRERDIATHQAIESKIAENKLKFVVEGKLRKYYEQVCFLEQKLDSDNTKTVKKYLQELSSAVGAPVDIVDFKRFAVGE